MSGRPQSDRLEGEVVPSELSWISTAPGVRNCRYPELVLVLDAPPGCPDAFRPESHGCGFGDVRTRKCKESIPAKMFAF